MSAPPLMCSPPLTQLNNILHIIYILLACNCILSQPKGISNITIYSPFLHRLAGTIAFAAELKVSILIHKTHFGIRSIRKKKNIPLIIPQ